MAGRGRSADQTSNRTRNVTIRDIAERAKVSVSTRLKGT